MSISLIQVNLLEKSFCDLLLPIVCILTIKNKTHTNSTETISLTRNAFVGLFVLQSQSEFERLTYPLTKDIVINAKGS